MEDKGNEKSGHSPSGPSLSSTLQDEEYGPKDRTAPSEVICKTYTKTAEGGVLTKTLSRLRTKDSGDPIPPPPDGGVKAWSQALLCHLVLFKYSCHTLCTTLTNFPTALGALLTALGSSNHTTPPLSTSPHQPYHGWVAYRSSSPFSSVHSLAAPPTQVSSASPSSSA